MLFLKSLIVSLDAPLFDSFLSWKVSPLLMMTSSWIFVSLVSLTSSIVKKMSALVDYSWICNLVKRLAYVARSFNFY